ncbi:MAG: NfeD family protein, partial [Pyrinomonadaceae bacterium]|nr:NfeD family protein [Pyrinomonadaceae bacterium]
MGNLTWILWTVLGVIFIIAEVFTPGFVLLWFGIGALAAAFASLVGLDSLTLQFIIFAVVSVALTAASRTIFVNYFSREKTGNDLKTGVDALPGKVGTVVTSSRGALDEGAVKVFGSVWTAYPAEGEAPLEAGDRVVVE